MRKIRLTHAVTRAVARLGKACNPPAPGGHPHQLVFEDALEVLHANIDYSQAEDVPLDQVELAFTVLTFSWAMVDGLARLGVGMEPSENEDHIYAWAAIGHMLGVQDELLPRGTGTAVQEARRLFERIRQGLLAPGDPIGRVIEGAESGRQLMAALNVILVDAQRENIPDRFRRWARIRWIEAALQDLPHTLVRKLCGRETARVLRVGRAPLLHWIVGQIALCLIDLRTWKFVVRPETRPGTPNPHTVSAGLF